MSDLIRSRRHPLPAGGCLVQLTLDSPHNLNALNLEMMQALLQHLREAAADDEAVAVFLDGEGERAFSAGGDVRRMRESALDNPGGRAREAERFFETEYRVDYLIHNFSKPVICWAQGITMGGGMGLLVAAGHRIVTGSTRLAMPEIAIGLYPDVGATWFLNRMPGRTGLFCALTGAQLNAADALYAGLADYALPDAAKHNVLETLLTLDWRHDGEENGSLVVDCLGDIEAQCGIELSDSPLRTQRALIDGLCSGDNAGIIAAALGQLRSDDPWLAAARNGFCTGAASTAKLVVRQLREGRTLSLHEALQMEMVVSANRVRDPDFLEGVRAQLVDKDRRPQWRYRSVEEVPDAVIAALFDPPWPHNPLADLA